MTYHEGFWLAVAAAAPVIALANTVSIADAAGAWLQAGKSSRVKELQDLLVVVSIMSAINLINQTISLGMALSCLYTESDNGLNVAAIVLVLFGLLVILVVTGSSTGFRVLVKLDRDSEEESPGLGGSPADVENPDVGKKVSGLGWPDLPQ